MSIATEIQRLQTAKADIKTAIEEKGVEVGDGTIDTFADKIREITVGGGTGGSADGCVTVTFMNGDSVYFSRPVYIGDDCPDPLTQGHIETPTKESTAQYSYTYKGWSATEGGEVDNNIFKNITEDKVIYAVYSESLVYYTVTFYDEDGTTVVHTEQVAYGEDSTYVHGKDNHMFLGWTPQPLNITSDFSCVGAWEESLAFADASWEYIAQMSESGMASKAFALGDTKMVQITAVDGSTIETPVQIVGFDHDDLADGTGKAGISIVSVHALDMYMFAEAAGAVGLIIGSDRPYPKLMQPALNSYLYERLPVDLTSRIKAVNKISSTKYAYVSATDPNHTYVTTVDKLWVLGASEGTNEVKTNTVIPNDGVLYEFFATPENRKKYIHRLDGVESDYWDEYTVRSIGRAENATSVIMSIYNNDGKLGRAGIGYECPIGFCI